MKIYWIFGSSASGKEHLINFIVKHQNGEPTQRLGCDEGVISVITSSIDNIGKFDDDPITKKRSLIIDEVMSCDNDSVCLIKGQDIDLEEGRITRLQELLPESYHCIVFLHADIDILYDRVQRKSRRTGEDSQQDFIDRLKYQIELLEKLKGITIITLDSSDDEYRSITFPPLL